MQNNTKRINYISDLHLDFWLSPKTGFNHKTFERVLGKNIFKERNGGTLVIAGDIGHYNTQNIEVLKYLLDTRYDDIVMVFGNHDYYLVSKNLISKYRKNSMNRVDEMRELIDKESHLHLLDGNVVEIDGIRYGGCNGWYDGNLSSLYSEDGSYTQFYWKSTMNDARLILPSNVFFNDKHKDEIPKIEAVYREVDVMITHTFPLSDANILRLAGDKDWDKPYRAFYTFNGSKYMQNGTMKYWICGHIHYPLDYEYAGVSILCNPLGYLESNRKKGYEPTMKSFEIAV